MFDLLLGKIGEVDEEFDHAGVDGCVCWDFGLDVRHR